MRHPTCDRCGEITKTMALIGEGTFCKDCAFTKINTYEEFLKEKVTDDNLEFTLPPNKIIRNIPATRASFQSSTNRLLKITMQEKLQKLVDRLNEHPKKFMSETKVYTGFYLYYPVPTLSYYKIQASLPEREDEYDEYTLDSRSFVRACYEYLYMSDEQILDDLLTLIPKEGKEL